MASALMFCNSQKKETLKQAKSVFAQIPDKMPGSENDTKELVALGKKLYFEKKLSINDSQSCNSCHLLDAKGKDGVDNEKTSAGALGKKGDRNSPSSLNAGFHIAQFWDGRAKDLAEQARGPILNPVEMGMPSEKAVEDKLKNIPEYQQAFARAYPGVESPITYTNLVNAIAAFERTLVTEDRFDDFLAGDLDAISEDEAKGLQMFMNTGCTACHSGAMVGAAMYQKMGVLKPYKNKEDTGRFKVTGNEADKYFFKVPSLRNVANTSPYFHDGGAATLEEAIKTMGEIQLGRNLDDDTVDLIAKFLGTMSKKKPVL